MHQDLYKASLLTARAAIESATAVEDTCIPDLAYSNARLQPRLRGGCLTPHYKDALYTAVMEYIPEFERVEASENEFENGNEGVSAADL